MSRTEIANIYSKADIFVLPSKTENFSYTLLEAMASKLPIILSEGCVVAKDLVTNCENGFIVPIYDWKTLAERITTLLVDRNLRQKMGEKNRKIVEEKFDKNSLLEHTLQLYERICP